MYRAEYQAGQQGLGWDALAERGCLACVLTCTTGGTLNLVFEGRATGALVVEMKEVAGHEMCVKDLGRNQFKPKASSGTVLATLCGDFCNGADVAHSLAGTRYNAPTQATRDSAFL